MAIISVCNTEDRTLKEIPNEVPKTKISQICSHLTYVSLRETQGTVLAVNDIWLPCGPWPMDIRVRATPEVKLLSPPTGRMIIVKDVVKKHSGY